MFGGITIALKPVGARLIYEDGGLFSGLKRANDATQQFGKSADGLSVKTVALGTALGNLAASGLKAVASGLLDATKAGAGFLAGSVSMAADLESGLSGVGAVLGASNEELNDLKGLVSELGIDPNLKVSSFEAAEALEVLARNGLDAQQIIDGAARSTVQLANATGANFGTAADVATDIMAQFNIEAANMDRAVDGIVGVTTNSKFTIDDYALAVANAGAITAQTGFSLEDMNTVLAASASNFSSGADAGTSLKTALQRLSNPTDEVAGLMDELGISLFDSEGNAREMADVVGQLNTAFAGMTEEQRAATAAQLGGADASRTILALAALTEDQFRSLSAEVNAQGQAADAAAMRVDNLRGALDIFGGIIESIRLEIGGAFLPILTDMTRQLSSFVESSSGPVIAFFQQFAAGVQSFVDAVSGGQAPLQAFFASLEGAGVNAGPLQAMVTTIQNLAATVGSFVSTHAEAFKGALVGIGAVLAGAAIAAGIAAIGTAVAALLSPIGLLVTGVAALGAAWNANWGGIQEKTAAAWAMVQPVLQQINDWLAVNIPAAVQTASDLWVTTLLPAIQSVGAFIQTTAIPALTDLGAWLQTNIPAAVQSTADIFNASILPALQTFGDWIATNLPLWQATFMTAWELIKSTVVSAVSVIVEQAGPSLQIAFDSITAALNTLGLDWSDVWGAIGEATKIVATIIGAAILSIVPIFTGLVTGIADGAANVATTLQAMAETFTTGLEQISAIIITAGQFWQAVFAGDIPAALEAAQAGFAQFGEFVGTMWQGIKNVFDLSIGTIIAFVGGFVEGVVGWFERMAHELVGGSVVPEMADAIVNVFFTMGDRAVEAVKAMGDRAVSTLSGYVAKFADVGREIVNGIVGAIKNGAGAVGDAVKSLAESALQKAKDALGISSPSKVFAEVGEDIALGMIEGILAQEDHVISTLLEMGKNMAGLAAKFAGFFETGFLAGLGNEAANAQRDVESLEDTIAQILGISRDEFINQRSGLFLALARGDIVDPRLAHHLGVLQESYGTAAIAAEKYNQEQERLLRLQQAQQQLDFLKTQRELLILIADNGLNAADILQGLELGINADLGGVIDALVRATEAMVETAQDQLQVSSPSKVFAKIGQQTMQGLAQGVLGAGRLPEMAVAGVEARMIRPPASPQMINNKTINSTINLGGVHNGMDVQMLMKLIDQRLAAAL